MSDELVQQVIDELDPTPAHEAAWPVSRRQTLRALAAAGLLGSVGSASAESAGTVIADEAVFSNYGSESVSDGWELTIDDDVFALTESDTETIGLPDDGLGSEVVTPSGVKASEFVAPDGTVVFEDIAIPDSEVSYRIDEGSGSTLGDSGAGGHELDFSLRNGGTWEDNSDFFEGTAPVFNGTDDDAVIDQGDTIDLGDEGTLAIAFRVDVIKDAMVFHESNSDPDRFYIRLDDNELDVGLAGDNVGFTDVFPDTGFYGIVIRWSDGSFDFDVNNGEETGSGAYSGTVDTTTEDWTLASESGGNRFFEGAIDGPLQLDNTEWSNSKKSDWFDALPWL